MTFARRLLSRLPKSSAVMKMTGSLIAVSLLNGAVGFLFWYAAARAFSPDAVGIAASAISAMLFLGRIALVGLGTTLLGELPTMSRGRRRLILTSLTATVLIGGGLGIVFAALAPSLFSGLAPIGSDPLRIFIFAVGVSLTAATAVLDQVLVGLFRSALQLIRNVIFSLAKLVILVLAGLWLGDEGMAIYVAWQFGILLSLGYMAWYIRHRGLDNGWRPLVWDKFFGLARKALMHHLLNVSRFAPASMLPIIVPVILTRADNAAFYIALLLSNYVSLVGQSATLTLFAVGAKDPDNMWKQVRVTMALSAASAIGGSLVFLLAGQLVLSVFGSAYSDSAYPAIAILAVRGFPLLIKDHWVAVQRIRRGLGKAAIFGWVGAALEVGLSSVGAMMGGLEGLAYGWLIAVIIQAAFVAKPVFESAMPPKAAPRAA